MTTNPTHFFNQIYGRVLLGTRKAVRETLRVAEIEAKKALNERRKKGVESTGMLVGSFVKSSVRNQGNMEFSGILFVGGPSAPYAPIVEKYGWKTKTGHKPGYEFIKTGFEKAEQMSQQILDKELLKVR